MSPLIRFSRNHLLLRIKTNIKDILVDTRCRSPLRKARLEIDRLLHACGLQRKKEEGNREAPQRIEQLEQLGSVLNSTCMVCEILARYMENIQGISQHFLSQAH